MPKGSLVLAINFKAYGTAHGAKALEIARSADKVASKYENGIEIIILPPSTELRTLSESVERVSVFAQHVDPYEEGSHTGYLTLEMIKDTGASGVMVNHSEHRIRADEIEVILNKARKLDLRSLVCANTPKVAAAISALNPEMIAVEPPELIGTGIPVSKAKPEVITQSVKEVRAINKDVKLLTGAGISKGEDVEAAIRLGTEGVLVASAIMKSPDPESRILEMTEALGRSLKR